MTTPTQTISAVVFDLDGLLVDSEPLQAWAWDEYVKRFGTRMRPEVLHQMLGLRAVDAVRIAVEQLGLPVTPEEARHARDEIFLAAVPGGVLPHAGARDLVDALRMRGVPLALATSGHRRYVDLALASAGFDGCFDVEVTAELVERGKPHPDVYLRAAELLGLEPARCLALEDAPNGIRSAKAAGMPCFAVIAHTDDAHDYSAADARLLTLDAVLPEISRRGYILTPA